MKRNPVDGSEMIWIPESDFFVGSKAYGGEEDELPQRRVSLEGCRIGEKYGDSIAVHPFLHRREVRLRLARKRTQMGWQDKHPMTPVTWQEMRRARRIQEVFPQRKPLRGLGYAGKRLAAALGLVRQNLILLRPPKQPRCALHSRQLSLRLQHPQKFRSDSRRRVIPRLLAAFRASP